ncbi:hypothetical protein HYC85_015956 [Camellia sinensis]|uniref:Uncharacterized protein n=1 Tax=Camellia sinensis TaxID=4442 RepID=A0A7J7H200_CAMSI|nr:hypothetical protein HYC85_015956 [Camellia sinensis]
MELQNLKPIEIRKSKHYHRIGKKPNIETKSKPQTLEPKTQIPKRLAKNTQQKIDSAKCSKKRVQKNKKPTSTPCSERAPSSLFLLSLTFLQLN